MIDAGRIKRVLVIKPSSLAVNTHLFPALAELHRRLPEAELDFLVAPAFAEILRYSPWPVSETILFERKKLGQFRSLLPEFFRLVRNLRRKRYDLILDFQGLTRSALFAFLAKGGPVVGFAAPREPLARYFYRYRFPVPAGHAVERYVNLVGALFHDPCAVELPELPEQPENLASLEKKCGRLPEHLVVLIPGARWASKQFPPELFAWVSEALHRRVPDLSFATAGSAGDRPVEEAIAAALPADFPLLRLCGKTTLGEMMELLRRADAVVSNDSGPIHAAAALRRPVFGFFGPTDPERTGPYSPESRTFQRDLPCIRCLKRVCPTDSACHALDPERIAEEISTRLETRKGSRKS